MSDPSLHDEFRADAETEFGTWSGEPWGGFIVLGSGVYQALINLAMKAPDADIEAFLDVWTRD